MKSANVVKITSVHSIKDVVSYNLQTKKTGGSWQDVAHNIKPQDLISFYGKSDLPGLSIQQKGHLFKKQFKMDVRANQARHPQLPRQPNWSEGHTLIQSFEYKPNESLSPYLVHRMGKDLLVGVHDYLAMNYGYNLDNGFVSTHIDRDHTVDRNKKEPNTDLPKNDPYRYRHIHLHNHIVIPNYNMQGKSIYPYLRRGDIYHFQQINNNIAESYDLNNYYFNEAYKAIVPSSSAMARRHQQKISEAKQSHRPVVSRHSDVYLAYRAFKKANDHAFNTDRPQMVNGEIPQKEFAYVKHDRDNYLKLHFGYQQKTVKDKENGKKKTVFHMRSFAPNKQFQQQWINIRDMRLLRWHDKKAMLTERLLWHCNFKGLLNKSVNLKAYRLTMRDAVKQSLMKPSLWNRFQISLASIYKRTASYVQKETSKAKSKLKNVKINVENNYGRILKNDLRDMIHQVSQFGYRSYSQDRLVDGVYSCAKSFDNAHSQHQHQSDNSHEIKVNPNRNRNRTHNQKHAPKHGFGRDLQ